MEFRNPVGTAGRAVELAPVFLGVPYVWNGDRPEVDGGVDCSGLVHLILRGAGVPGFSLQAARTVNSQGLANGGCGVIRVTEPEAGDLAFYGASWKRVTHVTLVLPHKGANGPRGPDKKPLGVISASGGGSWCTSVQAAREAMPPALVRYWPAPNYKRDFLGYGRPPYIAG